MAFALVLGSPSSFKTQNGPPRDRDSEDSLAMAAHAIGRMWILYGDHPNKLDKCHRAHVGLFVCASARLKMSGGTTLQHESTDVATQEAFASWVAAFVDSCCKVVLLVIASISRAPLPLRMLCVSMQMQPSRRFPPPPAPPSVERPPASRSAHPGCA